MGTRGNKLEDPRQFGLLKAWLVGVSHHRIEIRGTPTIRARFRARRSTGGLEICPRTYGLPLGNNWIGRLVLMYRNTASGRLYD